MSAKSQRTSGGDVAVAIVQSECAVGVEVLEENLAEVPPFYEVGTHSHHTLPLSVTLTVLSCLGTGARPGKHGDETADAGVVGDVAGSSNRAVGRSQ